MKRTSSKLILASVLAVSAVFFGLTARAQTAPAAGPGVVVAQAGDVEATFMQLDANKDGSIDKAEAARLPGLAAVFARADANGDGKLDKGELQVALAMIK